MSSWHHAGSCSCCCCCCCWSACCGCCCCSGIPPEMMRWSCSFRSVWLARRRHSSWRRMASCSLDTRRDSAARGCPGAHRNAVPYQPFHPHARCDNVQDSLNHNLGLFGRRRQLFCAPDSSSDRAVAIFRRSSGSLCRCGLDTRRSRWWSPRSNARGGVLADARNPADCPRVVRGVRVTVVAADGLPCSLLRLNGCLYCRENILAELLQVRTTDADAAAAASCFPVVRPDIAASPRTLLRARSTPVRVLERRPRFLELFADPVVVA